MKPYRILVLVTLLIALPAFTACCTKDIPPPENALEEPQELREAIDARLSQVNDARFKEVILDYFGEGERVKVRQLILVKRPDMLRVQTRAPGTDEIMSLLVTDGEQFAMHERDSNRYYTGEPTPRNINRLLPVDLSAPDVVRVMLGGAPWDRFDREPGEATLNWDSKTGRYAYTKRTPAGGTLSMQIRPTDYAVISLTERNADGELTYKYTTDDWQRYGEVALPAYRRFVWPARDLDFSLDVGDTQVDQNLQDALFQLPPPAGSKVIEVDDNSANGGGDDK
jgi:outer membrane lipoprotein-sorting protein